MNWLPLTVGILHIGLGRDLGHAVVEDLLLLELALLRDHGQRADSGRLADADAAAHAVERGDGHGVLIDALALTGLDGNDLGSGGRVLGLLLGRERRDGW